MKELTIGIDVGGTSAKIGLVDEKGKIQKKTEVKTLKVNNWKQIINEYLKPIDQWLAEGINVNGIGIGTPGFINKKTGELNNAANLPGLLNAPFVDYLKDKYKIPVIADNDATCAAVGEHIFGAGKRYKDFLMVTIGTGIGGGLILNDRVYRGADGYAGELGHIIVVAEGRGCTCGNRGCIEAYSSATAIIKRVRDGIKKGYITTYDKVDPKKIDAKLIFDKAQTGDPYSLEAVESAARYLGRVLGGIVNLLNIESIIIGGGVAAAGNFFIEKIRFYLVQVAWYSLTHNLKIIPAELLNDAGIIGAAALLFEENL
ncbi:MAG: ROK family protein [Spirochaetes bacterium]|nr:ROK family protein [Spirochaetota bacterium]